MVGTRIHEEWNAEECGMQLFAVTHRLYEDDYKQAVDFLIWMMAGIAVQTDPTRDRTDIELVTSITDTIYETTVGGKEEAARTIDWLKKNERFQEPAMKILDTAMLDKTNRDRAAWVLRMWIRRDIDTDDCAPWVVSNIALYMGHYDCGEEMLYTVTERMLLRIRDNFGLETLKKP